MPLSCSEINTQQMTSNFKRCEWFPVSNADNADTLDSLAAVVSEATHELHQWVAFH